MIAKDIIASFYISSSLKYARIFGRNFGHDTYTQHFAEGRAQGWPLKSMLVFVFYETFKWL